MERSLGVDIGYGFVKVTDGQEGYIFPSVVGEGNPIGILRTGLRQPDSVDDLRLTVDGQTYFVGKVAIRHSRMAFRCLTDTRAEGNDLKVLVLAALSLFSRESFSTYSLVTGLPPGRQHLVANLIEQIRGEHKVIVHRDQGPVELTIRINRVVVVPQPMGTYWSQTLEARGRVRRDSPLAEAKIGVLDIGFRTTDLAAIDQGDFLPELSKTIPVGLSAAYDQIGQRLLAEYGLEREGYALDEAVVRGEVAVAGRKVDITPIVRAAFEQLATKILIDLRSFWQVSEFDAILLTGGGGQALSSFLLPHIPQGALTPDPATANSRGYIAWANRIWSAVGSEA